MCKHLAPGGERFRSPLRVLFRVENAFPEPQRRRPWWNKVGMVEPSRFKHSLRIPLVCDSPENLTSTRRHCTKVHPFVVESKAPVRITARLLTIPIRVRNAKK